MSWHGRVLRRSRWRVRLASVLGAGVLFWMLNTYFSPFVHNNESSPHIERVELAGFYNDGHIGERSCEGIKQIDHITAQQSFHLHDNLTEIVGALSSHPLVRSSIELFAKEQSQNLNQNQTANEKTDTGLWAQFAGSGVWIPQWSVYLVVSRVVYTRPSETWPTISFLRAQIFDESWAHLENQSREWNGTQISFPVILNLPTVWWPRGSLLGPEDPRVVLEESVQGAEPIVVFNMKADVREDYPRAMWIHRPFSNFTTILTISGEERNPVEKNWSPFFHKDADSDAEGRPSEHLHFVYSLTPLRVLKCHIHTGDCDWVYQQEIPDSLAQWYIDIPGEIRGGTNFVPVPFSMRRSDIQLYVGLPKTHFTTCETHSTYRPEVMVLAGFRSSFHIAYVSDATVFGHSLLNQTLLDSPCAEGRILIPTGIASWDYRSGQDVMEVSFSIADKQTRIVRLQGILSLIRRLPYYDSLMADSQCDEGFCNSRWSEAGNKVVACAVEAAGNSSPQE